jgi:hypothetical protein
MSLVDREKLEILNGDRVGRREKAAVRVEDMAALLQLLPDMQSSDAAADPPTQAEFNALRADLKMIHTRLKAVAETLGKRSR